jgi:uncharacterized protein YPO0396
MTFESSRSMFLRDKEATDRYFMSSIAIYNWGTFHGVHVFKISKKGHIFAGPSGAGKSTALDAHTTLITPPKTLDYNVAARSEQNGRDRDLVTYVRGAWGDRTNDDFENVNQFLRSGSTFSVIAESYRNGEGQTVTLAIVMWMKGESTKVSDLRRRYFVFNREVDLTEFEGFRNSDFNKKYIAEHLADAQSFDTFSAYQECFRSILGIESETILKLLHKTQSTKDMGNLNVFLREFMLDEPGTFELAKGLVESFGDLNDAYSTVKRAEQQIAILRPAKEEYDKFDEGNKKIAEIVEQQDAINPFVEQTKRRLLNEALEIDLTKIEAAEIVQGQAEGRTAAANDIYDDLRDKRRGKGGGAIDDMERDINILAGNKPLKERKLKEYVELCRGLGLSTEVSAAYFSESQSIARSQLELGLNTNDDERQNRDSLIGDVTRKNDELDRLKVEIRSLEGKSSNIPEKIARIRSLICEGLNLDESKLPFAGELLEVKKSESVWSGAIERVLHGFGITMLVDNADFQKVSNWIDRNDLRGKLTYIRVMDQVYGSQNVSKASLVHKMNIAEGKYANWVRDELKGRFNFECCESADELLKVAGKGVTKNGQIKKTNSVFEKDDRTSLNDVRNWVLGFDNEAKLVRFQEDARKAESSLLELLKTVREIDRKQQEQSKRKGQFEQLQNIIWDEIDTFSLVEQMRAHQERINAIKVENPELDILQKQLEEARERLDCMKNEEAEARAELIGLQRVKEGHDSELKNLNRSYLGRAVDPRILEVLRNLGESTSILATDNFSLLNVGELKSGLIVELGKQKGSIEKRQTEQRTLIQGKFKDYQLYFPVENAGLDATMASADEYFAKLAVLEVEGLPQFKSKFEDMLNRSSAESLISLDTRIRAEKQSISERLDEVNRALATTSYNKGTHLEIESRNRDHADLKEFKEYLKAATSHYGSAEQDRESNEQRFSAIKKIVDRFGNAEPAYERWRNNVLDVREHLEFIAKEKDSDGVEIQSYTSASGKSGGERQKLTLTILAAALRYQLGGIDGEVPKYSTITIDEAFDKADPEFTKMTMQIFEVCGFQMVVATPLKAVMVLDEFVGSASYIHMNSNRHSQQRAIEYDEDKGSLLLSEEIRNAVMSEPELKA